MLVAELEANVLTPFLSLQNIEIIEATIFRGLSASRKSTPANQLQSNQKRRELVKQPDLIAIFSIVVKMAKNGSWPRISTVSI